MAISPNQGSRGGRRRRHRHHERGHQQFAAVLLPPAAGRPVRVTRVRATRGGTALTITGRDLSTATSVAFGTSTVTPTVVSDRQITVVSPAGAAGVVPLVVTTRGGVYSDASFTYAAPPTATGFTPTTSILAGGVLVSITGTNLATTTGVTFGGTPATLAVLSPTRIAASAPARGILGAVQIAVTTTGGSATAPGTFVYIL